MFMLACMPAKKLKKKRDIIILPAEINESLKKTLTNKVVDLNT